MTRTLFLCALSSVLFACGPAPDRGPLGVAIIGEEEELFSSGVRLSPAAQHIRAASHEGLVALDQTGQVVPALAERWIVTDDAMSYIFRLRNSEGPNGEPITAAQIRLLLQERIRQFEGTSLGLDFAKLVEVRAMTGRVIELRLSGPMPDFLRLLAQPELGLAIEGSGTGPMMVEREDDGAIARLTMMPPEARGFPARQDWRERTRDLAVQSLSARDAIDAFSRGELDLLMNGRIAEFPMVELGPLSRGAVQVDPTFGLFGFIVRSDADLLESPARREALSMAIDRETLLQPFGIGGWAPTSWIVPANMFVPAIYQSSRWPDLTLEQRREIARGRVAQWRAATGEEPVVRVGLPEGPGSDLLFASLARGWQEIGVRAEKVGLGKGGDLELRDRLARYSSPRWFLNQLNCSIAIGLCSEEADALVSETLTLRDPFAKQALLIEAHQILTREEVFIPLGSPVRWSLVRGTVDGYQANPWGLHPLPELAEAPN
ncbi:peptide ABC transporter substrate-binding protein [Erythrobacter longus]|uniref:Peptide ABC transporter substrate-binding protein n=1 Tax=Erythrobacter longus TaxID=1044 RepID=A0A074LZY5_ERYLO|nr:ABC transporter substrate-binding protein [Erythrobacter longus]KEO87731.1 peptide ABC transporter substrate-binding protein [Erythrobacter longus]